MRDRGGKAKMMIDLSAPIIRAKTGALVHCSDPDGRASRRSGRPSRGEELGARIGEAFQVADDLRDALYDDETLGKPTGQDDLHGRPNAVTELGVQGAISRLKDILGGAIASIPSCAGEAQFGGNGSNVCRAVDPSCLPLLVFLGE